MSVLTVPPLRHSLGYVALDDLISWAWKGAANNEIPAVKDTFKLIAEQFEKARDD